MSDTPATPVVLWDVGGTLVDYALTASAFLDRAFNRAGVQAREILSEKVTAVQEEFERTNLRWRTLAEEREGFHRVSALMLQESARDDLATTVRLAQALADYYDRYRPIAGIHSLLEDLMAVNVRQGVVSNWPPSLPTFLKHHRLNGYFTVILGSGKEGLVKPDPRLLRLALRRFDVQPTDAAYVGDNPALDIGPAREMGMRAVHFNPRGEHTQADARDVPTLRRILFEWLSARQLE